MAQDINKRTVSAAELMRQVEEVAATIGGPASPKDVKTLVRRLAAEQLTERADALNEAEASVPYPDVAAEAPLSGSSRRGSASQPPGAPDQSEVVRSGAGQSFNDPGPTSTSRPKREDSSANSDVSTEERPDPNQSALGQQVTAHQLAARAAAAAAVADADSFDHSATRQYNRRMPMAYSVPGIGEDPPPIDVGPPVLEPPPRARPPSPKALAYEPDTSSINLNLIDSQSGRPLSGVEQVSGPGAVRVHDSQDLKDPHEAGPTVRDERPAGSQLNDVEDFGAAESSVLSTSVIEAAALKHRGWFWFGAALMLACALGIGASVYLSATEEDDGAVYRVPEGEEAPPAEEAATPAVPEAPEAPETSQTAEAPADPVFAGPTEPAGTLNEVLPEEPAASTMRRRAWRGPARRGMAASEMTATTADPTPPADVTMVPTMETTMETTNSLADNPYRGL
ncbi:MAG: hypothetical protein JRH11_24655 [Deltaproteobacteria bacterium]|nr:hypothetical protein [Deltaproteobacteria bacterium]